MDLFLLIVSVAIAAYAAVTASAIHRARIGTRADTGGTRSGDLGHYELAFLAGDSDRVADTAIALLARRNDLRVSRGGLVHKVVTSTLADDPIEQHVLNRVAEESGLPVTSLKERVYRSLPMQRLEERLTAWGLVLSDGVLVQVRRLRVRLRVLSVAAYAGVVVEGLTAVLAPNLPALLATVVCLGTVIGTEFVLSGRRNDARAKLTPYGREALGAATRAHPKGEEGPVQLALYGLSQVRDAELRDGLRSTHAAAPARPRRSRGGSYSGAGSGGGGCATYSSSSSCGGGSGCGGGGCGGGS
ncbi:TIGR04222 domain-containing membrane protein [Nonomuraea gerenzanensis]|uniref:TIGR04222 domain-containing membrane protein n=1 Tax=Nonomuraea gerenzanensis TaxID=93944 RepID=A0A1M4EQM2_9ACTN|nr:TIGR04222 domain-containing membrane protein [Nonomuraea gerenzanensis]UBU12358.1 TIGR04222 domain-containing membrane protein [Nonomuraea gerenzanensis]SBP00903.1 hypothetical protein BN4615_P10419 [Nonomuraea gerenzanensis]